MRPHVSILAILMVLMPCAVSAQIKIVGYYADWLKFDLPPSKVQYQHLTHIVHAFAWPNAQGGIEMYDNMLLPELNSLAHQEGVKVLIALGGWGHEAGFAPVAADSTLRKMFIDNVMDFLATNNYDGVDLDWEFPTTSAERDDCTRLIAQMRQAMDAVDENLLLTMASPMSNWSGQWYDYPAFIEHLDWIAAMAYDVHGSWTVHAGHNAPLYPPASNCVDGSGKQGMDYLHLQRSIPKEKLLFGMPFYGKQFNAAGLYAAQSGTVLDLRYSEVPLDDANWTRYWDNVSAVPYLLNNAGDKFITYEDSASIKLKCEFAKTSSFAGVMIWALGHDLVPDRQPLLETVYSTLVATASTRDNPGQIESSFKLYPNYPNPFNAATNIVFEAPARSTVHIAIYNISGQNVSTLSRVLNQPGRQTITWDPEDLPSGIYFSKLNAGDYYSTQKMLLLK